MAQALLISPTIYNFSELVILLILFLARITFD